MTSLNFFEQVERELAAAKRDQASAEALRVDAAGKHATADAAASRMNRYVEALEDALFGLNAAVGRKPSDLPTPEREL